MTVSDRVYRNAAFGDFRKHRARKGHRCEWCGEWIVVGEEYLKYVGMFEGDFQSWKIHLECQEYQERLLREENDPGERRSFIPHEHGRGLTKEAQLARRLAGIELYWVPDEDLRNFG